MAILRKNPEEKVSHTAILSLGGNIGDVKAAMNGAISMLNEGGQVVKTSSLYETEAWGMENASPFLNQVIMYKTNLNPGDLLEKILSVEKKLGRERKASSKEIYQSRSIDIDILFYDDLIKRDVKLEVPHPRLHLRKFILEPLSELVPDFIHPRFKQTIRYLRSELKDTLQVRKL